jgi:hypothetical protein
MTVRIFKGILGTALIAGALINPGLVHAWAGSRTASTTTVVKGPTDPASDTPFDAVKLQGDIRSLQSQVQGLQGQVQNMQSQSNAQTEGNSAELHNIPGGG